MVRFPSYLFIPKLSFRVHKEKRLETVREEECGGVVQGNEKYKTASERILGKSRRKDREIKVGGGNVG